MRQLKTVAFCSLLISAATAVAAPPTGVVADPCPATTPPSAHLQGEVIELLIEPRKITAADFSRFLADPEIVRFHRDVEQRARQDWPGLCRYRADNASVLAGSNRPRVVFIGDSITENWTLADPKLFEHGYVNRGIGGQTSPQMLVRFRADVLALKPRIVHILAGTNDIAGNTGPTTPQDYQNNIVSMVELTRANGIEVILGSIPPAASFPWRPGIQPGPTVVAFNNWLREYASNQKLGFIDYYTPLAGPAGELKAEYGNDGVHPNRKGYEIMRKLVEAQLAAMPE